ncbi:MAG: dipeptidyl aminopeptidase [Bacteroidetes bacterium HGW-Bacteroidetes-17]|jgi:dipeptidyl aminopeptidase/acylaminoacyl peptidase|nr:MAG: dipeptidyl aminopeptidase [Bacteroidetes bacterium HGW-Bacteroidetes-17]
MKKLGLIFILLVFITSAANAQLTAFTPADALLVRSYSLADLTDNGNYAAGFIRTLKDRLNIDHKRYGDANYISPNYSELVIINTETKEQISPFKEKGIFGNLKWSPDGTRLAIIKYEDPLFVLYIYDIEKRRLQKVKSEHTYPIASGSELLWNKNDESIILSVRENNWSKKADSLFKEATIGPITVYDSKQPFLKWDAIRIHSNLKILACVDPKNAKVEFLTKEGNYSDIRILEDGSELVFIQNYPIKTVYEREGGSEFELVKLNLSSKERTILEKKYKAAKSFRWDEKNLKYAYADSGKVFMRNIYEEKAKRISIDTTEIIKADTSKVKFTVEQWSPDNKNILVSSKKGYWLINSENSLTKMVYEFPEKKEKNAELNIVSWSPDAKYWFMSYSAKDKWDRGLFKYDIVNMKMEELFKDSNLYSRWKMSKDGSKFFYNFSDGNQPDNFFKHVSDFGSCTQLTDLNPWINTKKLTKSELIKYRDSDGNELNGILYYPVNYDPAKKYPLVCEIYETFFDNGYSMSMNLISNAGFFGFKPSVNLEKGYPGEAWIKGITAGINKLIDQGLIDETKLGVHGTSYGGYATSLLISQTNRFAAAINISGKVNIISFLGDSPRIGTRNYAAAENGQDRIGETLWDAPLKYLATSAVLFADRINTPHLLLTGEGDWNVPAVNSRELYYALRRLGKEVVWVNYYNGGHGAGNASNESDFYDHWDRIINWYNTHFEKSEKETK